MPPINYEDFEKVDMLDYNFQDCIHNFSQEVKMELPNYITNEEVQRICKQLGIRDWTKLTEAQVLPEEAKAIQEAVGGEALQVSLDAFLKGLEVELEHGRKFPDSNVTNNHPVITGKIVQAHLKETLDYYTRLDVAEFEGDMLKAFHKGDGAKLLAVFAKLLAARATLAKEESA